MTIETPWYVRKATGREGGPRFRLRIAGWTPLANRDFVTPAIPSPYLIDEVSTKGRAEAWLAPDGGQWRSVEGDRGDRQGAFADELRTAEEAGETVTIIGIWRE